MVDPGFPDGEGANSWFWSKNLVFCQKLRENERNLTERGAPVFSPLDPPMTRVSEDWGGDNVTSRDIYKKASLEISWSILNHFQGFLLLLIQKKSLVLIWILQGIWHYFCRYWYYTGRDKYADVFRFLYWAYPPRKHLISHLCGYLSILHCMIKCSFIDLHVSF